MWLPGKGLGSNARKLVKARGPIKSMDVVVPVKRGELEVKVRLRLVAKPEEDVAVLLFHLGLRLRSRSKTEQNDKRFGGRVLLDKIFPTLAVSLP